MPTALTEEDEPVNVLYYGDGGSGKTTDLATMALHGPVWLANAESGVKASALRRVGADLDIDIPLKNFSIFPGDGEAIDYESLENEWKRLRDELAGDPDAYFGAGWDSITEIQAHMKDLEMQRSRLKASRRGVDRDPFVMDQDNWRTVNEQCRALIRKFMGLPIHFCASALQRREQDNDGSVVYMPGVTPGLQNDVIGWFDVVCHTETVIVGGEEVYMGLLRNMGKFRGKDRFKATPRRLVNPTHDRILQYVRGELTPGTDPQMQDLKERMEREEQSAAEAA